MKEQALTLDELKGKLGADKIEVHPNEKSIQEQAKEQAEQRDARLRALIQGDALPPNEFVTYLVTSIQQTNQEIQKYQKEKMQLEQRHQQVAKHLLALNAVQTKALEDIITWDKSLESKEKTQ